MSIIGAGIAGVGVAAELAGDFSVVIIEQEDRPGYHSTGRSAAIFIRNYGNAVIRALNRASAPLFDKRRPDAISASAAVQRGVLYVADDARPGAARALLAQSDGLPEITAAEAVAKVPILRREKIAAAAYEEDAQDIDVAALHEGWLRKARGGGMRLLTDAPLIAGGDRTATGWSRRRKRASRPTSSSMPQAHGPTGRESAAASSRSGCSRCGARSRCCRRRRA